MAKLRTILKENPQLRVVVIDTWRIFMKAQKYETTGQQYNDDADAAHELQRLAKQFNVEIICLHHGRKQKGSGVDSASGTYGLTGSFDHLLYLTRDRRKGITTLEIEGRVLPPRKITFEYIDGQLRACDFDKTDAVEQVDNKTLAIQMRKEGLSDRKIATKLGVNPSTVSRWFRK
ncbi:MAG: helix-turn-helix domain-containing protein [Rhodospirillales bacterium]